MAIPVTRGGEVDVSKPALDIEILSRTPELTYAIARQRRAHKMPYTYHFRLEKNRLYYQFALPPKYIRELIVRHLKYMNIRAYDIGLKRRKVEKRMGIDVE